MTPANEGQRILSSSQNQDIKPVDAQFSGDDAPDLDETDEIALDKAAELRARRWLADPAKYGKEGWPGLEKLRKKYGHE